MLTHMLSIVSGPWQGLSEQQGSLSDAPRSLSLLLGAGEGRIYVCGYVVATSIFLVTPSFEETNKFKGNEDP